jgi:hypothetical protein
MLERKEAWGGELPSTTNGVEKAFLLVRFPDAV